MNQGNQNQLKPWLNDVAVLSIFFARPDVFAKSFSRIKEARPRILLLWQDGPREGHPNDMENIEACRKIASDIDWECEVYTNYHEKNMGCDPSTHYAHKWAFTIVDKCIILEDDIVPSMSFFPFCKELLDKYENDQRIDRICGMNVLGTFDCDGDYFFMMYGHSWGWATWKRVADNWDTDYNFLKSKYACEQLEFMNWEEGRKDSPISLLEKQKMEGVPYWEMVTGVETLLNWGLVIYPSKNLIQNVGLSENSTHAPKNISEVDDSVKDLFYGKTYEYSFPLQSPQYMFDNKIYRQLCGKKYNKNFLGRYVDKLKRGLKKLF